VYIYTSGLLKGLDIVFSVDEPLYHYPTIITFAQQLPFPDITDYGSATTPLFHLLFAALSKIVGTDIRHLRLINFFITYASVVFLFNILVSQFKITLKSALIFTLIFTFSPYYFREAFVVLTDNLPVLWLLFFFNFYFRYKTEKREKLFLLSRLFIILLCLTRQSYLFVSLAVGVDVLLDKITFQQKIKKGVLLFLSIAPTLLFFLIWKGVTPPSFTELHTRQSLINTKAVLYGFSVIGFYSFFILGYNAFLQIIRQKKILIISCIMLAWAVTFFWPMTKAPHDFGYLWYMAQPLPKIAGTSLLFYFLEALGVMGLLIIYTYIYDTQTNKNKLSFLLLFLIGLLLSEVPNNFLFQRYYDNSILLSLIFFSAQYYQPNKIDTGKRIVLIAFFIMYFVVFTVA
jgi:hypothetical protein